MTTTVLGAGRMGSALAATLHQRGIATTVWNRTRAKTEPLARLGIRVAATAADAVRASHLILVCVNDYAAADLILHEPEVTAALAGKTLVQLTTGSTDDARRTDAWAREHGIAYLDGAIMGYPDRIGTPEGNIVCAGPCEIFDRVQPVLGLLWTTIFAGETISAAAALELAGLTFRLGAMFGFLQAHLLCDEEGVSAPVFLGAAKRLLPLAVEVCMDLSERIRHDDYAGTQATLAAWSVGPRQLVDWLAARQMNDTFPRAQQQLFDAAIQTGHQDDDLAYLYQVMRAPQPRDTKGAQS
jgi:3-hydroxyisobutyrate dehydrogenase-like beta-hydroxyacid dehydrogenase